MKEYVYAGGVVILEDEYNEVFKKEANRLGLKLQLGNSEVGLATCPICKSDVRLSIGADRIGRISPLYGHSIREQLERVGKIAADTKELKRLKIENKRLRDEVKQLKEDLGTASPWIVNIGVIYNEPD